MYPLRDRVSQTILHGLHGEYLSFRRGPLSQEMNVDLRQDDVYDAGEMHTTGNRLDLFGRRSFQCGRTRFK